MKRLLILVAILTSLAALPAGPAAAQSETCTSFSAPGWPDYLDMSVFAGQRVRPVDGVVYYWNLALGAPPANHLDWTPLSTVAAVFADATWRFTTPLEAPDGYYQICSPNPTPTRTPTNQPTNTPTPIAGLPPDCQVVSFTPTSFSQFLTPSEPLNAYLYAYGPIELWSGGVYLGDLPPWPGANVGGAALSTGVRYELRDDLADPTLGVYVLCRGATLTPTTTAGSVDCGDTFDLLPNGTYQPWDYGTGPWPTSRLWTVEPQNTTSPYLGIESLVTFQLRFQPFNLIGNVSQYYDAISGWYAADRNGDQYNERNVPLSPGNHLAAMGGNGPVSFHVTIICAPTSTATSTATRTPTRTPNPTPTRTSTGTIQPTPTSVNACQGQLYLVPVAPVSLVLTMTIGVQFSILDAPISVQRSSGGSTLTLTQGNYEWGAGLGEGAFRFYSLTVQARLFICQIQGATATPTISGSTSAPCPACIQITAIIPAATVGGALPDLAVALPTLRPLPTITATVSLSLTVVIGAIATIRTGMQTPMSAVQTAAANYTWQTGQTTAAGWLTWMQPALDWLAILNPNAAAWTLDGGPLWALAPLLLPVLPILGIALTIAVVRFLLWLASWFLKLVDLVIKLIELIPFQ